MDVKGLQESFDRLYKKQRVSSERTVDLVDDLISQLLKAKAKLEDSAQAPLPGSFQKAALEELNPKVAEKAVMQQLSESQKETNALAGKVGKALERALTVDISKAYRDVPLDDAALSLEILRHLYRIGMFDVGDSYAHEAGLKGAEVFRAQFQKLHEIVRELRSKNVGPALKWAQGHRLEIMLRGGGMNLEFLLHKLQFLHVLTTQGRSAGLMYARAQFGQFGASHMGEIQRLMGALLWGDKLKESPYAHLLGVLHWESMASHFSVEYLSVMGESSRSPLDCVLAAGAQALPMLLKLSMLMSAKPTEWRSMAQLPVEIELGKEFQFHSIFACPVSREQSSVENPPMLLPCCHVLCKLSILKLAKGSSRPFKCPYCPMETTPGSCRPIQF